MSAARCASTAAVSGVLPSSSRALASAGCAASRRSTVASSPARIAAKSSATGSGAADGAATVELGAQRAPAR